MHVAMIDIINELVKNNKEQKAEIRQLKKQQHFLRASGGGHPDDVDDNDNHHTDVDLTFEALETKLDVLMELDPRKSTILRNSSKMMMRQTSPAVNATKHSSLQDSHKNR